MITVTHIVRKILKRYPFYAEALGHGIVNYSALARLLKKETQKERMEAVSDEAIAIALKRDAKFYANRLKGDKSVQPINSITVRPNLAVVSFEKSPQLPKIHQILLKKIDALDDPFLHYDEGMRDINFVVSRDILPKLKELAQDEKLLIQFQNCSLITVTQAHESLNYPGVCERFFRILAWDGVNLISFFHTYGEISFVVEKKDADKTYELISALQSYQR